MVLARDLLAIADRPIDTRVLLRHLADRFPSYHGRAASLRGGAGVVHDRVARGRCGGPGLAEAA